MKLYLGREWLSPEISLWRVYPSEESRLARGHYVGAFVLVPGENALIAKGFIMQRPGELSMEAVRDIAEQIAKITGTGSLVIERHGRWLRVNLYNLQVQNEKQNTVGACVCSNDAGIARGIGPMRLEYPGAQSVSG